MADTVESSGTTAGAQPVSEDGSTNHRSSSLGLERPTSDPAVVKTERGVDASAGPRTETQVRSIAAVRSDRRAELRERYGGLYLGSDFIGFAVATFFTILFLGIVGAAASGVGYQVGAPLPKVGHAVSGTTQTIGIGAAVASLIALFIAYIIGGYTAGRMVRFDGVKNGLGVVAWTIIVAALLGVVGAIVGNKFNVASQLHLKLNSSTFTTAGLIALAVALLVMVLGAAIGGAMGERYHRAIDRDAGVIV